MNEALLFFSKKSPDSDIQSIYSIFTDGGAAEKWAEQFLKEFPSVTLWYAILPLNPADLDNITENLNLVPHYQR